MSIIQKSLKKGFWSAACKSWLQLSHYIFVIMRYFEVNWIVNRVVTSLVIYWCISFGSFILPIFLLFLLLLSNLHCQWISQLLSMLLGHCKLVSQLLSQLTVTSFYPLLDDFLFFSLSQIIHRHNHTHIISLSLF